MGLIECINPLYHCSQLYSCSLGPHLTSHQCQANLALAGWLLLGQIYSRMTSMKQAGLEVSMQQLEPSKFASMKEFIDKVQIMQQEIMHAGKKIASKDLAILLLSKLLARYSTFYSSLITSERMTELTWEELVAMVLDQEDWFKATSSKLDLAVLTSQAKSKKKGKKNATSSSKSSSQSLECTCHKCGEKGHIRKDCPSKCSDEKPKTESTSTPSIAILAWAPALVHIIALDREEISSSETLLMASSHQEWIIDSGATRNMSPMKDGLTDYLPQCGEVLLGDNTSLWILGTGNLRFLPDGYGGSYTLSVLHVPILHYSLLSVHELCKLGLSLEFVDDQFLVQDKHKKVLLEGAMNTGLYKISVGSSLLTTNSSSALWHARFGHLNVDYLQKAAKMVDGLPTLGG